MKFLLTTFSLMVFFTSTGQSDFEITWQTEPDNDSKKITVKTYQVDSTNIIAVYNRIKRPMGLNPYIYKYDPSNRQINHQLIEGWKSRNVLNEIIPYNSEYHLTEGTLYRIFCKPDVSKDANNTYRLALEKLNFETMRAEGEIRYLSEKFNRNRFLRLEVYNSDKYIIVCFESKEGEDVFYHFDVFHNNTFEAVYQHKMKVEEGVKFNYSGFINNSGVFTTSYTKTEGIRKASMNTIQVSKEGVVTFDEIHPEEATTISDLFVPNAEENALRLKTDLIQTESKGTVQLTTSVVGSQINELDRVELDLFQLINDSKALLTEGLKEDFKKNSRFLVSRVASEHNFHNGSMTFAITLKFAKVNSATVIRNFMFTTIMAEIDLKGNILWINALPVGRSPGWGAPLEWIYDSDNNIHLFSNELTSSFDEDDELDIEARPLPGIATGIHVKIDGSSGEMLKYERMSAVLPDWGKHAISMQFFYDVPGNAIIVGATPEKYDNRERVKKYGVITLKNE